MPAPFGRLVSILFIAVTFAPGLSAAVVAGAAQTGKAPAKPATHATSGIVRSASATSLEIARSAQDAKTMTFVLTTATRITGTVAVGGRVEVRYRSEGGKNVATAITVRLPKSGL